MSTAAPALLLDHLEREGVRTRMVLDWTREVEDLQARLPRGRWPFGRDLKPAGWDRFFELMPVALREMDLAWLANSMSHGRFWNPFRLQMRRRQPYQVRVNVIDAAAKLAQYEFSAAYTVAVASLALEEGIATCEVYRAGFAAEPRPSCECLQGPGISCRAILEGHRAYTRGAFAEIAVPAGPHCHHSIRIRDWLQESVRPNGGN
jgi:hypothetical protein